MIYLRTNSFIVQYEDWMKIEDNTLIIGGIGYEIVKQSSNVEELFDLIVENHNGEYNFYSPKVLHTKNNLEVLKRIKKNKKSLVYGAIWTSGGLYFEAMMLAVCSNGEIIWRVL